MTTQSYPLKIINKKSELASCTSFLINHFYWNSLYQPKAYGKIAVLENTGFIITMTSEEVSPLRKYTAHQDPVYKDSALEVFLCFGQNYFNIEINANGAILAQYGYSRYNRQFLSTNTITAMNLQVTHQQDRWTIDFILPFNELSKYCPNLDLNILTCNFYKICESNDYLHFGSYAKLNSDKPNFHLPEFFIATNLIS